MAVGTTSSRKAEDPAGQMVFALEELASQVQVLF